MNIIFKPSERWAREHLWDHGIQTHDWVLTAAYGSKPMWYCKICNTDRVEATGTEEPLAHIASEEHRAGELLAKLAGDL
jgi:hypothetical protein